MQQYIVNFNNGASCLVYAADKYDAILIAKERTGNKTGVREVKDTKGRVCN